MNKQELRELMIKKRKGLSQNFLEFSSDNIMTKVIENISDYNTVFVFISFGNEVLTNKLIDYLWQAGKTVCIPLCLPGGEMVAIKYTKDTTLNKNTFGVLEPENKNEIKDIDVSVTPGLAFDLYGNRLGYGRGYYDKFFASHPCKRIAVCFDFQICNNVPTTDSDVKVDKIITEERLFNV